MKTLSKIDPQQLIMTLLAVRYLQEHGGQVVILQPKEIHELAKYTIRLEIISPEDPVNSPIKCSVISVVDAMKLLEELKKEKETT